MTLASTLLALLALAMPAGALAQAALAVAAAPSVSPDGGDPALRQFIERAAGHAGRVEVKIGQLDSRLQLAPCAKAEPFLPPGARLWGRTAIGVRCVQGASWSVSLPVTVTVRGPALVAANTLAAGAMPSPSDFRLEEIELTREPLPVLSDPTQFAGKVMARPIAAGQPLRADHLKAPQTVAAGDPIRIRLSGQGFAILAEGVALSSGGEGQAMRARTESGRIVSGTLRDRTVDVAL